LSRSLRLTLDVGCGSRPLGDVNVDIYKEGNPQVHVSSLYNTKEIPNFVLASGSNLPFRNGTFETVISDCSLEHTSKYCLFLKELLRVSNNHVLIKTPHILSYMNRKTESHQQYFNIKWFNETLTKLGLHTRKNFDVYVSSWNFFPHQFLPLIKTPRGITVNIFKKTTTFRRRTECQA